VDGDTELIPALQAGQEQAFVELVARYHTQMTRLARTLVATPETAAEVV
jgi:DNA-directed RNA polymerase specialized sigma24 family protein